MAAKRAGRMPLLTVARRGPATAAKTELNRISEMARVLRSGGTTSAAAYFV